MKKAVLTILLISLMLLELVICSGFLPIEWQHAINERISNVFSDPAHDWSRVTHPRMDLEMDEVFRQHLWLRISFYIFTALLLAANTVLIRLVWQRLHGTKSVNAGRS
ncbi:MAG TPA: hypothetical protein VFI45_10270 [Candidatus Acidoferrum sp.]|nr:hypothetical protein [Candidatus Acidoferrum sp.]